MRFIYLGGTISLARRTDTAAKSALAAFGGFRIAGIDGFTAYLADISQKIKAAATAVVYMGMRAIRHNHIGRAADQTDRYHTGVLSEAGAVTAKTVKKRFCFLTVEH
jgi:hypothetical protein